MRTIYRVWGHRGEHLTEHKLVRETECFRVFQKRIGGELVEEKEAKRPYNQYYDHKVEALAVQRANLDRELESQLRNVQRTAQIIAQVAVLQAQEEAKLQAAYQEGQTWAVQVMDDRRKAQEVK